MSKISIYKQLTDRVIAKLKQGEIPWKREWKSLSIGMPKNFLSKRAYSGVNFWNLLFENRATPYWLTFKQVKQLGGKVNKGEKSTPVVFWKMIIKVDGDEQIKYPIAKKYNLFNLEQTNLTNPFETEMQEILEGREFADITNIELFIEQIQPKVAPYTHSLIENAYYRPSTDTVMMPDKRRFEYEEAYYATLFHEFGHSTGHTSRLNRDGIMGRHPKGSPEYAREELVAELVSCFLCETVSIVNGTIDNASAYIQHWLGVLQKDERIVYDAMRDAFKVLEYLNLIEHEENNLETVHAESGSEEA
jgi:antirestriction protein ArdC